MCTLTWEILPGGYELHFNRDESRLRAKAIPPEISIKSKTSVIMPRDPEAGGTWISLNEYGVGLCLLNNYQAERTHPGSLSRGLLVNAISLSSSTLEATRLMADQDVSAYSPFDLLIFSPDEQTLRISWNGHKLTRSSPTDPFLSSSGFDTETVIAGRKAQFQQFANPVLADFHQSHIPARSAYSVCMHRDDAQTLSYSKLRVDRDLCSFWYADGPPCSADLQAPLTLNRSI